MRQYHQESSLHGRVSVGTRTIALTVILSALVEEGYDLAQGG